MRKTLFIFATCLAMMASMTSSSCNNDDDDDNSGKPETPTTPTDPETTDQAVKEGYCPDSKHPHAINLGDVMVWVCCVGVRHHHLPV